MEDETLKRQHDFLKSTKKLFSDIRQWVEEIGLKADETTVKIDEPPNGVYDAAKLTIINKDRKLLAELVPVGTNIIAADWRVDMIVPFEKEVLVYWMSGAPEIDTSDRKVTLHAGTRLFKGADQPGWYWIEDTKLGRARPFNKELFIDLLEEVANP